MGEPDDPRGRLRLSPDERTGTSVYCPYCEAFVETSDRTCPRCLPGVEGFPGGRCPRCASALAATPAGGGPGVACSRCRGTWLDRGTLFLALDLRNTARRGGPKLADVRRAMPPAVERGVADKAHAPCARCGEPMSRRPVAPLAGILVDLCPHHGLWFDAGELERFAAFVAAGGLELARRELGRRAEEDALLARSAERAAQVRNSSIRRAGQGFGPIT